MKRIRGGAWCAGAGLPAVMVALLALGGCTDQGGRTPPQGAAPAAGVACPLVVQAPGDPAASLCMASESFGAVGQKGRVLVVMLHGDLSNGGPTDYIARWAKDLASHDQDLVVVALARPGYGFTGGARSGGSNNGRRDSYTAENVEIIGNAIRRLKADYEPRRTVLMGHSGGAAIAGVLGGRDPGLAEAVVLVSCPCDVPRWRADRGRSRWPNSLSPVDFADGYAPSTRVVAMSGANDSNTPPALAQDFVEHLEARGVDATFIEVPRAAHNLDGALWNGGVRQALLDAAGS